MSTLVTLVTLVVSCLINLAVLVLIAATLAARIHGVRAAPRRRWVGSK
jgi:hypothetical protein